MIFGLEGFAADISHISLHTGQQKTQIHFYTVKASGKGGGIPRTEMGKTSVWGKRSCGEGHKDVNKQGKPRAKEYKMKVFRYVYD